MLTPINTIRSWYEDSFWPLTKIATELGCTPVTVANHLRKAGVTIRGRNGKNSSPPETKHHFFKNWDRHMAYVLGYTIADGCISEKKYSVSYKSIDLNILEYVRSLTNPKGLISSRRNGKIFEYSIYSKEVVTDLIALGVTPRKSLTVQLPNVPHEYFWDFLRGLIDGDGNIRSPDAGVAFSLTGSVSLITSLAHKLHELIGVDVPPFQKAGKAITVAYYGQNAVDILWRVYNNPPFGLPRKMNCYKEAMRKRTLAKHCVCGAEIENRDPSRTTQQRKFCDGCQLNKQREANRRSYQKYKLRTA